MPDLRLAALMMGSLLAITGCATDDAQKTQSTAVTPFGHVHGIGLNPGDDRLYVASHNGVFRLDDGTSTLVAGRAQDTMGFTIASADRFLASGHPGIGSDDPNPLGLISSTDRADTWDPVSLGAEADLHAIDTTEKLIYAYGSSGTIIRSDDDGQTWDVIAPGEFIDIAADPTSPDQLLATTPTGVLLTIGPDAEPDEVTEAPPMVFVDRTSDGRVVGLDPNGSVFVGSTDAADWEERSSLGSRPEALSVRSDTWFAATDSGLFQSRDEGATWDKILIQDVDGQS